MKHSLSERTVRRAGFSLIELMVVVAIMALLATLTLMGMGYAQRKAKRDKTSTFHRGIISGLTNYYNDWHDYPEPKGDKMGEFGGKSYHISGALMLYQALSGDGDDEIKLASGKGKTMSNGKLEDNELDNIKLTDMPRDMWVSSGEGYVLVDGFGRPFQYERFVTSSGGSHAAPGQRVEANTKTVNGTYDLWSYGEDEEHTEDTDLSAKRDVSISAKWIKNW